MNLHKTILAATLALAPTAASAQAPAPTTSPAPRMEGRGQSAAAPQDNGALATFVLITTILTGLGLGGFLGRKFLF